MINVETNSLPGLPVGAVGVHAGQVRGIFFVVLVLQSTVLNSQSTALNSCSLNA